jgi:UDP:flavonoid glycosyltransferase YjiC (YdhE family)
MTEEKKTGQTLSVVLSTTGEMDAPAPGAGGGSMLSCAIASVVSQSYPDWELWVISDHPQGQARNAIKELVTSFHDDRIHFESIAEDLAGPSGHTLFDAESKRRGVQCSRGDFLTFLDPGNTFEREHFRRCMQAFDQSNYALDLVYCDTRIVYTGMPEREDLLRKAANLPYHFLGALHGENFSEELKGRFSPPQTIAPLAGMPYTPKKPVWDSEARKKLEHHCFIEMSDAVMTRQAYDAAGGIRDLTPLDWHLWRRMIRAGRSRFRHIPHVGVRSTMENLAQYRERYAIGAMAKLNLPLDFIKFRGQSVQSPKDRPTTIRSGQVSVPLRDRPARILFMGEALAISHVARPSLLAAYLHQQGYDVCVARDSRYSHLINESGLEIINLKSLPTSIAQARLGRQEPVHDADTLDRYVQEDLRVFGTFKPDIVVGDQRHSLAISSRLAKIPYVNIADGQWSPFVEVHFELPSSPLSGIIGMPLSNLMFRVMQPLAFAYQSLPLNVVRMKYGLPGISSDIRVCGTYGDHTVYPNDPELFTLKEPLPPTHTFIGPILWSPSVDKPEWWNRIPEDRPVIYVSLGSTGRADLLSTVFKVLGQLSVTVIAATAGRWNSGTLPDNIFIADFLPGTEAARRSQLVICNGGTMSGQQSLSAGTPYLGLISNLDQMIFSTVVRNASACELLREGEVNEMTLRPLILCMLAQEKYQTAAKRLAARTKGSESCEKFEGIIHSILESKGATNAAHRSQTV